MVVILYFMFTTYATGDLLGSPGKVYDLLKDAATLRPIAGNQDGSYMTMKSNNALIFGVIQLCSGSGTVFLDQGESIAWALRSRLTDIARQHIGREPSPLDRRQPFVLTSWEA